MKTETQPSATHGHLSRREILETAGDIEDAKVAAIETNAATREPTHAKERGVENVSDVIEDGDPTEQILRHAETDSTNLIVMGRRGLSDLKGLLMGSVSHKVSQLSSCTPRHRQVSASDRGQ
jgi:nucleotide-binding universal stress UspA family protein